jgi:hypothetical protein
MYDRSHRPRGLILRGFAPARFLGLWIRIPPGHDCLSLVSVVCCVLSYRGLCFCMITCPEESYRLWCAGEWSWSLGSEEVLAYWRVVVSWGKYASGLVRSSKGTKMVPEVSNLQQPFLIRTAASSTAENVIQRDYKVKLFSATNSYNVDYSKFQINTLVVHNNVFRRTNY